MILGKGILLRLSFGRFCSVFTTRPRRAFALLYIGAVVASHLVINAAPGGQEALGAAGKKAINVPAMLDDGAVDGRVISLAYKSWLAGPVARPRVPVILLHGSPGDASNFDRLAPLIESAGRDVYAIDLPGFGHSSHWLSRYSGVSHAHAVLAFMDELGVDRAHVVGWSNGGGVGLFMADLAPDRIATLTMLASIGLQETEGSGSYAFEHLKYAVGYGGLVVLPELLPHFGVLGPLHMRHALIRNFWDSDQRRLGPIMEGLETPTLIVHGRDDFLVADLAAVAHHEAIESSRLVMLEGSHFIPVFNPQAATEYIAPFMDTHEMPGVAPVRTTLEIAGPKQWVLGGIGGVGANLLGNSHWAVHVGVIALLTLMVPEAAILCVVLLFFAALMDFGVGLLGVMVGLGVQASVFWMLARFMGEKVRRLPLVSGRTSVISMSDYQRRFDQHAVGLGLGMWFIPERRAEPFLAAGMLGVVPMKLAASMLVGIGLWAFGGFVGAVVVVGVVISPLIAALGPFGLIVGMAIGIYVLRFVQLAMTWTGRRMMLARVRRVIWFEYWPWWVLYVPVVVYAAYLGLKHRGMLVFTCCNPGIGAGGGFVGESKWAIYERLAGAGPEVLATELIKPDLPAAEQAREVCQLLESKPQFGGLPVILKPDSGQRGYGVRLARTHEDILEYFESIHVPAVAQAYHAGPHECGVVWVRSPSPTQNGLAGRVFSITRKDFPKLIGDGRRTVEQLVLSHKRYRCQSGVFFERFADELSHVPANGEILQMSYAGNHSQGTLFRDGQDLQSEALEQRIDEIAKSFGLEKNEGLDWVRFDIRYESDDALRAGQFGIVELNGTTAESTNLYDPAGSILWAYKLLLGQWRHLYELGSARRDQGVESLRPGQFVRHIGGFFSKQNVDLIAK